MTANKSERLLNLLILLLVARTFVTKDQIRDAIEEYRNASSGDSFEKMFERDKEELRSLGIPVETGSLDVFFEDEVGYKIKRDAFELPQLEFEPDEAAVVGLAARVWQHAGLAEATSQALLKLKAAGLEVDREALDVVQPRLVADEPAFDAMWSATQSRTAIAFDYRPSGLREPARRHLQPWGVVSARGRWYVVGHDSDRGEPRLFRLSRVVGEVTAEGKAGSFVVPDGTDVRSLTRSLAPAQPVGRARLRLRPGAARDLRLRAVETVPDASGWDAVEVEYGSLDAVAGEVLAGLDAVIVESPPELRDLVVSRLTSLGSGTRDPRTPA